MVQCVAVPRYPAVVDRLGKLNGKVAAHEEKIGDLLLQQAERRNQCPLVDKVASRADHRRAPLERFMIGQKAAAEEERAWMDRLQLGLWAIARVAAMWVLQNGRMLLELTR